MYRAFETPDVGLVPVGVAIRETRMKLEQAEWDDDPMAIYYHQSLQRLKGDANRGILEVNPDF